MKTIHYNSFLLAVFLLTSLFIYKCSENIVKPDVKIDPLMKIYENGFISKNIDFNLSKEIDEDAIINIMHNANFLIDKERYRYTHPIYFANMVDLYLLNKNGIHYYNPRKDKLITLREYDILNDINNLYKDTQTNNYIMLSISTDEKRLHKGIRNKIRQKYKYNNDVFYEHVRLMHTNNKNKIKTEAIIEAGSIVNNIMLSASAQNLAYSSFIVLDKENEIKEKLKVQLSSSSIPFMLIPIAEKKNANRDEAKEEFLLEYLTKLIKKTSLKLKINTEYKGNIHPKQILKLLWSANGFVSDKKSNKTHISGMPNYFIELYHVMPKTVEKYDPTSNSLVLTKTSPHKHRIEKALRQYKVSNAIIITKKQYKNYKEAKEKEHITLFQIGIALQNIQTRAKYFGIKYAFLKVPPEDRKIIANTILLKRGYEPIFIIPIGKSL